MLNSTRNAKAKNNTKTLKFKIDLQTIQQQLQSKNDKSRQNLATIEKSFLELSTQIRKEKINHITQLKRPPNMFTPMLTARKSTRNCSKQNISAESPIKKYLRVYSQWCNKSADIAEPKPCAEKLKKLLRASPKHKAMTRQTGYQHEIRIQNAEISDKLIDNLMNENSQLKSQVIKLTAENEHIKKKYQKV